MLVADRLKNCNTIVKFSSYGEAARYISMYGYKCITVPPVEFTWNLGGDFSIKYSIANIPRWFTNFSIQVNKEIQNMIGYNPDIIISDTRLSSILAAKVLGISSVVILNQAKLLLSPRLHEFKMARLFEKINGELLGSLWSMSDKILIPDLPPPYTLPIENHGEQLGNSAKIAKIGVGIILQTKQLNTKVIIDAIYQILNHSIYQDKANEIMKLTDKLNGIDKVIKTILSSLSKDIIFY